MSLARKAARAEKNGDRAQAYIFYSEASALQPTNRRYRSRMELLQTGAAKQARTTGAAGKNTPAEHVILSPDQVFDSLTQRELTQARELQAIPTLNARPGKQNFNLTGVPRELFRKVAEAFGLEPVFDGDYPPSSPPVTFRVTDVDYREALTMAQAATASFVIPLSARVFMVAKDTPPKRTDLEQTMAVALPIPQILTTQELTEMAQVVRQITGVEKIGWDSSSSRLVVRDRVSRVIPTVELLNQLFSYRPEVMIDLEFVQVGASDLLTYGANITNTFTAYYLGNILSNVVSIPKDVTTLLSFGGGSTLFGFANAQIQALFNATSVRSDSLYRAQLRSVAGQAATLHVGEKYPVITGGYSSNYTAAQTGYVPAPIFTYENLGLEMKVTPYVHGADEVTVSLETSFEVLTGQAINDIPVIGRRAVVSQARLRNDEWTVIGTLQSNTQSRATSGFWGLAQLPMLGYLFRQTSTDTESATILIGIKPRLLSLGPDRIVTQRLRVGTEAHPYIPL